MRKPTASTFLLRLLLAAGSTAAASATSFVPIPDGALADQAQLIVEGTVEGRRVVSESVDPLAEPFTEYRVRLERRVKGSLAGGTLAVRVPGGEGEHGVTFRVFGAPEFAAGDRLLLFLVRHPDGSYRPLHLMLGAFRRVEVAGRELAVRDLAGAEEIRAPGQEPAEPTRQARDFAGFSRWLADRAAGLVRRPDYYAAIPPPALGQIRERFTYLSRKVRWFEFDRGASVGWRAHDAGLPGYPGGGYAEFQTSLQAWNDDPATNIRLRYDGTTPSPVWNGSPTIFFDDFNGVVPGTFDCTQGGVLASTLIAFGGGPEPTPILAVRIIVNDGSTCWYTRPGRLETVLGHEVGHSLGLGHSCGDSRSPSCSNPVLNDALMRASAQSDGRGARLNADDRAGIFSLYAESGLPRPTAPSGLTATAISSSSVLLTWVDNSPLERSFRVEMRTTGPFKEILKTRANATSATIMPLASETTYRFRVRGRGRAGFSPYSEVVSVRTPAAPRP